MNTKFHSPRVCFPTSSVVGGHPRTHTNPIPEQLLETACRLLANICTSSQPFDGKWRTSAPSRAPVSLSFHVSLSCLLFFNAPTSAPGRLWNPVFSAQKQAEVTPFEKLGRSSAELSKNVDFFFFFLRCVIYLTLCSLRIA